MNTHPWIASLKRFFQGLSAVLVLSAFVLVIVTGVGIYRWKWSGVFAQTMKSMIPYPVVILDEGIISMATLEDELATLDYYYRQQGENPAPALARPPAHRLRELTVQRLMTEQVKRRLARRYRLRVTDQEVDDYFKKNIVEPSGDPAKVDETVQSLFRWTVPTYKRKLIHPVLLEQKLEQAVDGDRALQEEARTKAQRLREEIASQKQSFDDAAKAYSEDDTASQGGDLGFFKKGEMVKPFEDAAFVLQPGELSEVVQSEYGYHLIQVVDRAFEENANGEKEEQIHAKHILIKTQDAQELLLRELQSARVRIFDSSLRWDPKTGQVVSAGPS